MNCSTVYTGVHADIVTKLLSRVYNGNYDQSPIITVGPCCAQIGALVAAALLDAWGAAGEVITGKNSTDPDVQYYVTAMMENLKNAYALCDFSKKPVVANPCATAPCSTDYIISCNELQGIFH